MKITRLYQTALLALAAIGCGMTSAHGQATYSAGTGQLLMGFRATTGNGSTENYEVSLGPVSTFEGYTSVTNIPLSGVAADLAVNYGAGWHSRTDLLWSVAADIGTSAVSGDPPETLFATKAEATNGTTATPWNARGSSIQTNAGSVIDSAGTGFNLGTAATNASTIAKMMVTSANNAWSDYQPGGGQSSGISFGTWNPTIEGTPSQYLDLFKMVVPTPPAVVQAGTFLGRLILNSDGSLTFVPGAIAGQSTVQFDSATYTASQSAGTLNVNVTRTGDTTVAATVNISTADGTGSNPAIANTDYTAITNQAVNFTAGQTTVAVPVTLLNPSNPNTRTFTVSLSGGGTGVTIGAQGTATCSITHAIPSVVSLAQAVYTTNEGTASINIGLTRTGGADAVSVTLTPSTIVADGDTAVSGTDYTATPVTVQFTSGSNSATGTIPLGGHVGAKDLQFHVTATSSGSNPTIGATSVAAVRLLLADTVSPTLTLTAPTLATIPETAGGTVTVSGTATDDKGIIDHVSIVINGGTPVIVSNAVSGFPFSGSIAAVGGLNTLKVQAFDAAGNASPVVTKTFTYVKKRALNVVVAPNSMAGSVTGVKAGAVYQVGSPLGLTAVAKTGFIFDHWTANNLAAPATDYASLATVVFTDAMAGTYGSIPTFTATFIANPFTAAVAGAYSGLVIADGTTTPPSTPSNATNGLVTLTLTTTGTFTGTLKIDGFSLPYSGFFDNTGTARFGSAFATTLLVPRGTAPAYVLDLALNLGTSQVTGDLKQFYRATQLSNSKITLNRGYYSAANPVPGNFLVNRGLYNIAFLQPTSSTSLATVYFPQGDGYGTITVTNLGAMNLATTLADGTTKVTASGILCKPPGITPSTASTAALYSQLYTGLAGSLGGLVTLDDTQTNTDVAAADFFWFRPWQNNVQYYPWGWPEGLDVAMVGTKVAAASTTVSVVPGLPNAVPNATLTFTDGQLTSTLTKSVTITPTNAVTNYPITDKSFTLTVNKTTSTVSGTFQHTNGNSTTFGGAILQKGTNSGAFGFFQTFFTKIDGTGECGGVTLIHK